jgi:peptidoglycan/LPS O-acetylase OafA/YrhL
MKSYRLDIDGLRALAVIVVIAFHLDISLMAGGHIGVDIFFVLSGFLITSIITRQLKTGSFSATTFYNRRVRRLFPALYTTVALSFVAATFILQPDDFERFCRSAIASVFSVSNFLFWSESGYWDVGSETKVLLHTWSLGVEEQFYLIWPSLLLLVWKLKLKPSTFFMVVSVVGFIFCYLYTQNDPSGAFYLLPARFFQFAAGGFLATLSGRGSAGRYLDNRYFKDLLLIAGTSLIFLGCVTLGNVVYPGSYALLPTVGALFVLLAGSGSQGQGKLGHYLLENKPVVWVGKLSYSLYLVHWPIIVLYRYVTGPEFTDLEVALLLVATFLAGGLMHYGVERRFYSRRFTAQPADAGGKSSSRQVKVTLAFGLSLALTASLGWLQEGWTWRFDNLSYPPGKIATAMEARFINYSKSCKIQDWPNGNRCPGDKQRSVLFIGNSQEPDGLNFIMSAYAEQLSSSLVITFGTINECKNLSKSNGRWQSTNELCQARLDRLFDNSFIGSLDLIIYSSHHTFLPWSEPGLEMVQDLKSANTQLKVLGFSDYIETKVPCVKLLNKTGSTRQCFSQENIAYSPFDYQSQVLYEQYHALFDIFIDRLKLLCAGSTPASCASASGKDTPYSFDNHHISLDFSTMSGRMYAKREPTMISELLGGRRP